MDSHPALDISGVDGELVLAVVDAYSPTAVEEHDASLTIFFPDPTRRDEAQEAVARAWPDSTSLGSTWILIRDVAMQLRYGVLLSGNHPLHQITD